MAGDYCPHLTPAQDQVFTTDILAWNVVDIAWVLTAVCVIIAVALTFKLLYAHCKNFHKPQHQKHIVRILVMVPVYSIDSWLSFRFYWLSVYFDLFRDCYEAFVIYEFYSLLVEYTGGYEKSKSTLEQKPSFKLVIPLCCWEVAPKRGLVRWLSRLTLQYVVIKPPLAVMAIILETTNHYCSGSLTAFGSGYPYIIAIEFVSVTMAMYALILYYVVARKELTPFNPIPKFLSIKFIIAISFWQSVVVAGLVDVNVIKSSANWSTANFSEGIQNTLICFEMLMVSVWHLIAFNHKEFSSQGARPTSFWRSLFVCFNLADVAREIIDSFFVIKRKKAVDNSLVKETDGNGASLPGEPGEIELKEKGTEHQHPFSSAIVTV